MKFTPATLLAVLVAFCVNAAGPSTTNQHTALIGQRVLELFETRDTNSFADAIASTNIHNRKQVIASAQLVITQAAAVKVDREHVRFTIKEIKVPVLDISKLPSGVDLKKPQHPQSFGIRITLHGEPVNKSDAPLRGEYELALGGAEEYPDGWRTYEGIRWVLFPQGVADEALSRAMQVINALRNVAPN
jgi:hypothetical protein